MGIISTSFEFTGISKGQKEVDSLTDSLNNFFSKANELGKLGSKGINLGNSVKKTKVEVDDLAASLQKMSQPLLKENLNKGFSEITKEITKSNNFAVKSAEKAEKDQVNFTKQSTADILRLKRERVQREKELESQLTKQAAAENKLRVNDVRRMNQEAIREIERRNRIGGGRGIGDFSSPLGALPGGNVLSGLAIGGIAGGVAVGLTETINLTKQLGSAVFDLGVDAVKTGAEFESTYKSIAVFAGGISQAKSEIASLDSALLKAKGIRLDVGESGYNNLRALNFSPDVAQNLTVGLGLQKRLANVDDSAIQRVLVNFQQIQADRGRFTQDFKEIIHAIPTLKTAFQTTFGTLDRTRLKDIFDQNPDAAFERLGKTLASTKVAQEGLTTAQIDFQNQWLVAKRLFAEPILDPLADTIKNSASLLERNKETWKDWGNYVGNVIRGINVVIEPPKPNEPNTKGSLLQGAITGTSGIPISDVLKAALFGGTGEILRYFGEEDRRKTNLEKAKSNSHIKESQDFMNTKLMEAMNGVSEDDIKNAEKLKKLKEDIFDLTYKTNQESVTQNLELQKALAVRNAKGDILKLTKETTALENQSLRQQIALSNRNLRDKIQNLSTEDWLLGKGDFLRQENDANIFKLNNQIKINDINLQTKLNEEYEKTTKLLNGLAIDSYSKLYSDNPIATAMIEGYKATEHLKESLKFLPKEFKKIGQEASKMQDILNNRNKIKALFDSRMQAIDLRNDANNFRNPFDAEEFKRKEDEFVNTYLYNNPNYLFLKRNEFDRRQMLNPLGSFRSFEEETRYEILKNSGAALNSPKYQLNNQLQEKYNALYGMNPKDDALTAADRTFIAATQSVNPLDLNPGLREAAARARENEAIRTVKYQTDSLAVLNKIAGIAEGIKNARNEGSNSNNPQKVEVVIKDEAGKVARISEPTPNDTAVHYGSINGKLIRYK